MGCVNLMLFFQMLQLMGFRDKINDLSDAEQVLYVCTTLIDTQLHSIPKCHSITSEMGDTSLVKRLTLCLCCVCSSE